MIIAILIIEKQKNGDDTIITSQIITIFTINWIIAYPYSIAAEEHVVKAMRICRHGYTLHMKRNI